MPDYREWINQIDINIDYYSAFIKAWIAFNGWYNSQDEYKSLKDSQVIEKIKNQNNDFKNHIINLITGDGNEVVEFKNAISNLNVALDNSAISYQQKNGTSEMISFTRIAITNPKNNTPWTNCRYNKIKVERTGWEIKIEIQRQSDSSTLFSCEQELYDEDFISRHPDFAQLSPELQRKAIGLYREVNPYLYESIISTERPNLQIGAYFFINNPNKIACGLIEVLYRLRCSLMHGDISPSESAMSVYENAYYILKAVLKRI